MHLVTNFREQFALLVKIFNWQAKIGRFWRMEFRILPLVC